MSRRLAWFVTSTYMLVAVVWILASDTILGGLGLSARQTASLGLYKGLGFVLVTGTVLFFSLSRAGRRFTSVNERLSAIIEVSPIPIVTLDLDERVTLWNPAAEAVFGWTAEEVLGKPNPFVPDEAREESRGIHERISRGQAESGIELVRVAKDGRKVLVRVFTAAIHDDRGALTGTMGVIEDITQRRAARHELEQYRDHLEELVDERTVELRRSNDALQQATEAKDKFLASMSHELRTPLNSIIGFSGIMLQGLAGPLNEEQGKQLKMVNLAGHHLLALINDVLDLVKIESGQTVPNIEVVRISEVLESVEGILRPLADEKHLELRTVLGSDISLITDRRRLEQILLNLLSNAVKFTAHGSVSLSVSSDEEAIRFEVADTGAGVAREALESIFDEFVQIELPEKLRPEGTGLGLAISRRLASLLGGRVFATSEVGVGSTFTLELPVAVAASAPVPAEPRGEQCSVLVVDDDAQARAIVSVVLRAEGYRVVEAVDGEGALNVIAVDPPDCIVLDLVMPRLDGWEVLDRLRNSAGTADIPVICVSIIDEGEQSVARGFAGYLVKPIDPAGLVAMISDTLAGVACRPISGSEGLQ